MADFYRSFLWRGDFYRFRRLALVAHLVNRGNRVAIVLAGYYLVIGIDRTLQAGSDLRVRTVVIGTEHPIFLEIRFGIARPSQFDGPQTDGSGEPGGYLGRKNILGR